MILGHIQQSKRLQVADGIRVQVREKIAPEKEPLQPLHALKVVYLQFSDPVVGQVAASE